MNKVMPDCWLKSSKPHLFCPGCGHSIILKQLGFAIDELKIKDKVTLGIDIGCSLLAWNFFDFDTIQTHHGRTTPVMIGYKMIKPNRISLAYMGDGGGYAIGLQSVLHAAFRNDPITIILVNNGNYAMTGGQMAPSTIPGDITTTSPKGSAQVYEKSIFGPELISKVAHAKAFIARSSISRPLLLKTSIKKAIENQIKNNSFSFLEVLSICPTNWKTNALQSFNKLSQMDKYFSLEEFKGAQDEKN